MWDEPNVKIRGQNYH